MSYCFAIFYTKWKQRTNINKLTTENRPYKRKCTKTHLPSFFLCRKASYKLICTLTALTDRLFLISIYDCDIGYFSMQYVFLLLLRSVKLFPVYFPMLGGIRHTPWKLIITLKPCYFLFIFFVFLSLWRYSHCSAADYYCYAHIFEKKSFSSLQLTLRKVKLGQNCICIALIVWAF